MSLRDRRAAKCERIRAKRAHAEAEPTCFGGDDPKPTTKLFEAAERNHALPGSAVLNFDPMAEFDAAKLTTPTQDLRTKFRELADFVHANAIDRKGCREALQTLALAQVEACAALDNDGLAEESRG